MPRADKDSPEKAIYELAHAVEHRDTAAACGRLIDRAALSSATTSRATCGDAPADVMFNEPLVWSVADLPDLRGEARDVPAACAKVALDGARPQSILLVRPGDRWLVVRVSASSLKTARPC